MLAASFIARLLQRHRWIKYVGLAFPTQKETGIAPVEARALVDWLPKRA
jgi:hypothetical protein